MKKPVFLFLIYFLALSGIISAQNKVSYENIPKHQFPNPGKNTTLLDSVSEFILNKTAFNVELCDSVYNWRWDSISSSWTFNNKETYLYDVDNRLINITTQFWNGASYSFNRYLFTYDLYGNNTLYLYEIWNGSSWSNSKKFTRNFDSNNLLINNLWQNWNGNSWVNMGNHSFTYDSNNNRIEFLSQIWNGLSWNNYERYVFTYDINNNLTSFLEQYWSGGYWSDGWLRTYTYDGLGNNTGIIRKLWDWGSWQNIDQEIKSYDSNNNMINRLVQSWYANTWINSSRYTGTFNSNNKIIQDRVETWNGSNWIYYRQLLFTYTPNNFYSTIGSQNWNGNNWINFDSSHYYYHLITDIKSNEYFNEINIYPNPTREEIKLMFNSDRTTKIVVNICNSLGQEIKEIEEDLQMGKNVINIKTSELPEGLYFIKCRINDSVINKKFIRIN
jgi:hypothetical protein